MTNSSRYKLFKHADFIILDMVMVVAAYILAIGTRFGFDYISAVGFYRANIATVIVFCIIIDLIYPFYRDILHRSRLNEVKMTFLYVTSIVIIMIVFNFFLHNLWMYSRLVVFLFWVYACADVYIARLALKNFIKLRMKNSAYLPRVLLICSDSHLDEYLQYLNDHKGTRFRIAAAFVAVRHDKRMKLPVSVTFNNNVLIKEYETDPALSLFDDDRAQQDGNRPHQADDADLIHDVTDKGDDSDRISDVNNKDDAAESISDVNNKDDEPELIPIMTSEDDMYSYLQKQVVDDVVISITDSKAEDYYIRQLSMFGKTIHVNLHRVVSKMPNGMLDEFADTLMITSTAKPFSPVQNLAKRILDIIGSIVGLIITAIAFIFVAPIIKITSPGPIFFAQTRIGLNGRPFRMYKFRSMYVDAEERKAALMEQNKISGLMFKIDNDPRITPVGRFIRKYSIDELPQFFNVLTGSMSLVGTRPPTKDEYDQYNNRYKARLVIKPGITGLWQISGRSDILDFDEVVDLDLKYIRNWSIMEDIKILIRTVIVVFKSSGAE